MGQVVQLDATTVLIKNDNIDELAEIIDFASQKNKICQQNKFGRIHSFLAFAAQNKILDENYRFNRDECYDREDVY